VNKKYLSITVVLLVISILLMACGGRDLSRPSTRLVGHWGHSPFEGMGEPLVELYFGELNEEGVGSYFYLAGGETGYLQYRVVSESGDTVTISVGTEPSTMTNEATDTFEVAADGSTFIDMYLDNVYQYIDSKTEP